MAANIGCDGGVVDRGVKSVERETSSRVESGAGSRDAAVDERCLWIANVADVVDQGLAGREEDDAGSMEKTLASRSRSWTVQASASKQDV